MTEHTSDLLSSGTPTLGVEEEFVLCDPRTGRPRLCSSEAGAASHALGVSLQLELSQCQVETSTSIGSHIRDLRDQLCQSRAVAAVAAAQSGSQLLAVGTPFYDPPANALTPTSRYRRIAGQYGALTAGVTCGCHVHVGVEDRERAVQVVNHVRPWLPALLALTANSPISAGADTGYASWRHVLFGRWPSSGPPPYFESVGRYDDVVGTMLETGVILDPHMVYWDVRLSDHLPTVEIRISDVPATVAETTTLATLVHALVVTSTAAIIRGEQAPAVDQELLRAACWRAARDGLAGRSLDVKAIRLLTAHQAIRRLVDHVSPTLAALGEVDHVAAALDRTFDHGNGAVVQRRAFARRGCLTDVLDVAARRTVEGCAQATDAQFASGSADPA
ncbi:MULTISPECIES: glutamate--cysteine ligase 2 [Rhodococcus erythropolis group]|uniref:glutamate--cysteine ligase 2 n=1 Tax=Rhodococcus erythropolis group TaxID=2840174 RepID=UPI001BE631AF|nr:MULTISPECIES: glutamate--cysteine ligase [Rhodococcus erythropolis group]MBT2269681.1 glutamate--cysteine ligase [Rhodococcus erythropolis]MBT2275476.1 glutamate--cysteine ligase [Rhodococcus qingshengii]